MKFKLIMVGKTNDKSLVELIEDYVTRLKHYVVLEQIVIPELKNSKSLPVATLKEREADFILSKISGNEEIILLDEKGKYFTSMGFSKFIAQKMNTQSRDVVFVIGGAFGFSPRIYEKAADKIALSSMTFSHQMIRLLFVEQLYRAMTILKNEHYHHE